MKHFIAISTAAVLLAATVACTTQESLSGTSYSRESARHAQTVRLGTIISIEEVTIEGDGENVTVELATDATTGDGILTAIMVTEEICDSKLTLSKLCEPVNLYPQYMKNIRVKNQDAVLGDTEIAEEISIIESKINGKGRALLRKSGTEPVIRIMIESETEEMCTEFADRIAKRIVERGYAVE